MSETYELKHPITLRKQVRGGAPEEETISEVTLRRLRAKDLRLLDKHPGRIAQSLALVSALTGLGPVQVDELDIEDVNGIAELMGDFLPMLPPNGGTFSET